MRQSVIGLGGHDKFHGHLLEIDVAAACVVRAGRCSRVGCGGRLDAANYPRKARGLTEQEEVAGRYHLRLSLCCAVRGCRRRATPPSVRFLGRLVYAMRFAVLWAASPSSLGTSAPAPTRQTAKRWAGYWERVRHDAVMAALVGALMVSAQRAPHLVVALMEAASGTELERTVITHRQLAPLTTATVPPEGARLAMLR